ncbi:MAG: hypothetical protein AB7O80_19290 [Acetobacteraceae bacterium]
MTRADRRNTARCGGCVDFVGDALAIEAAIPGLNVFSSAFASVRGDSGLCRRHDICLSAQASCDDFRPTIAQRPETPNMTGASGFPPPACRSD